MGTSTSGLAPNIRMETLKGRAMATADVQIHEETESERIERWRQEALERAGYAPSDAHELAASPEVDLHVATRLLEQGCEPALALKILL